MIALLKRLHIDKINDRYEIINSISEGLGACSFIGTDHLTQQKVFMKYLLFPRSQYEIDRFEHESFVLDHLIDPEQMSCKKLYFECIYPNQIYCIVTEWCEGTSLSKYLLQKIDLSTDDRLTLFHRICSAVAGIPAFIHHRDLHPGNILILNEDVDWFSRIPNTKIKIVDWGTAIAEGPLWQDSCHHLKFNQLGALRVDSVSL